LPNVFPNAPIYPDSHHLCSVPTTTCDSTFATSHTLLVYLLPYSTQLHYSPFHILPLFVLFFHISLSTHRLPYSRPPIRSIHTHILRPPPAFLGPIFHTTFDYLYFPDYDFYYPTPLPHYPHSTILLPFHISTTTT